MADSASIRMGDALDFENFMGAVIDENAFKRIGRIAEARARPAPRSWPAATRTTPRATSSSRR